MYSWGNTVVTKNRASLQIQSYYFFIIRDDKIQCQHKLTGDHKLDSNSTRVKGNIAAGLEEALGPILRHACRVSQCAGLTGRWRMVLTNTRFSTAASSPHDYRDARNTSVSLVLGNP